MNAVEPKAEELDAAPSKLVVALARGRSIDYCHRLWSRYVRLRDGMRCVACHDRSSIAAHHILRKSFLEQARFEPGNGISLCSTCHAEMHVAFNRRPNLQLPMDAEGGENIERMVDLLGYLASDAQDRGLLGDRYYYVSDSYLRTCKEFQSIDPDLAIPGCRLEQAYWVWRQTPRATLNAVMSANGIELPRSFVQTGPISRFYFDVTD